MVVHAFGIYHPLALQHHNKCLITYINNSSDVTLNRSTTKKEVRLIIIVSCRFPELARITTTIDILTISSQILDGSQARLPVCHTRIHVMLLAMLINAETFEIDVSPRSELWLARSWDIDGRFHG